MSKAIVTAIAVIALALSLFAADHAHGGQFERHAFRNVSDIILPEVQVQQISGDMSDDEQPDAPEVPEEAETPVTEDESTLYVDSERTYEAAYRPTDGLTRDGGVNYHEGRRESYYSSTVLYHKDTADWELDEDGFYRDDEGYYVVAASDMEQGTVFDGSMGECKVYDTGCPAGTTDYYVKVDEMR